MSRKQAELDKMRRRFADGATATLTSSPRQVRNSFNVGSHCEARKWGTSVEGAGGRGPHF